MAGMLRLENKGVFHKHKIEKGLRALKYTILQEWSTLHARYKTIFPLIFWLHSLYTLNIT